MNHTIKNNNASDLAPLIWHNEKRIVKELVPYELNPRTLSDEHAEKLKKSLSKFNLVEIPAIDTNNKIIAAHQKIKILLMCSILQRMRQKG